MNITKEIIFKTARSGGKGGQNVNKVETMVEGYFHITDSRILTDTQKTTISEKLASRINAEGFLQVRSQTHRSQLENKEEVVRKMEELIKKRFTAPKTCADETFRRLERKKDRRQETTGTGQGRPQENRPLRLI